VKQCAYRSGERCSTHRKPEHRRNGFLAGHPCTRVCRSGNADRVRDLCGVLYVQDELRANETRINDEFEGSLNG
jgi:hypothetical protein